MNTVLRNSHKCYAIPHSIYLFSPITTGNAKIFHICTILASWGIEDTSQVKLSSSSSRPGPHWIGYGMEFLDALASLDFKLSVSEWVIHLFQLAHLRVFQSYFDRMWYALMMVVDMRVFFVFNMSDHIKYMRISGRRHHGRQGHLGGEDQGGRWH